jgi:hypothetical protein
MNSLEFDALKLRIVAQLSKNGPTTSQKLAAELSAPHGNVRLALEQLHDSTQRPVKKLAFGFWDSEDLNSSAA